MPLKNKDLNNIIIPLIEMVLNKKMEKPQQYKNILNLLFSYKSKKTKADLILALCFCFKDCFTFKNNGVKTATSNVM